MSGEIYVGINGEYGAHYNNGELMEAYHGPHSPMDNGKIVIEGSGFLHINDPYNSHVVGGVVIDCVYDDLGGIMTNVSSLPVEYL